MASRGPWTQPLAFALILTFVCTTWAHSLKRGSVYVRDGHCSFVEGERRDAAAFGSFHSSEGTKSGWAQLYVETNARYSDEEQMRAAGYLEGVLTAYEISAHHLNMESFFNIKTEAPAQWLLEQDAWSREQVAVNRSAFWATLGLLLEQHSGMMEGYWAAANESASRDGETLPQMSVADFLKLSAVGRILPNPFWQSSSCGHGRQMSRPDYILWVLQESLPIHTCCILHQTGAWGISRGGGRSSDLQDMTQAWGCLPHHIMGDLLSEEPRYILQGMTGKGSHR